jgi:hypothetical protein
MSRATTLALPVSGRRYISPALFLVGAALALSAAFELVGFYGGTAAVVCLVLGVVALPSIRTAARHHGSEL